MRKNFIRNIFLFIFSIFVVLTNIYADDENIKMVYVIPIKGEINPATTQFVKSSIKKAEEDPNAVAIIFEIDTLGGMIDQATKIRDAIMKTPLRTISYVNNKAESAGVLLTIASENIVMVNGSTIGSAETIPYTEKNISYWKSELRSTAEQRGRDARLVEAMADRRIELTDPNSKEKYIVRKGELLNLTAKEAERLGFTDLITDSYEKILDFFNIEYTSIKNINPNYKVVIAQWVSSSIILPIILSLAFIGLVVELFTPGFGIGGTVSIIAFTIFFGGSILAGNANTAIVMIFITGIILLIIEVIVPGFGAPGIGGAICIILSIILASDSIILGVTSLIIAFILTVVAVVLLFKYAPRNRLLDKIILATELRKDVGFVSTTDNLSLLGQEGTAITSLRPAGTIKVGEKKLDVVTEGEFIENGARVIIIHIEGRRIVVRKID